MWQKVKPFLPVLPALIVIGLLFFGGLIHGIIQSLGYFPAAGQNDLSGDAYTKVVRQHEFWLSLTLTLRVAALSTLTSGVLGLLIAVGLYKAGTSAKRQSPFWRVLFQLPLTIPHLVAAYLMVLLFMQSGWIARWLYALGWLEHMEDFPVLVNDSFGWGMILTYTWKEAPFITLMVYPVLWRIHVSWQEAARVFGAGPWQWMREVVLPLLLPAWSAAMFIVFAFSFSAFEVPYLLGVTYPKMLPVLSFEYYTSGGLADRPQALAVNVVLSAIAALLGGVAYRLLRRWLPEERKRWL